MRRASKEVGEALLSNSACKLILENKITAENAQTTAAIISKRLESLEAQIKFLEDLDNTQAKTMLKEANSERFALIAVLWSLQGDSVLLNTFQ